MRVSVQSLFTGHATVHTADGAGRQERKGAKTLEVLEHTRPIADGAYLLRVKEAEERYHIPSPTLYEMAANGTPGFVRMGRSVRIHRRLFEQWLDAQAA